MMRLFLFLFFGCKEKSASQSQETIVEPISSQFADGDFSAKTGLCDGAAIPSVPSPSISCHDGRCEIAEGAFLMGSCDGEENAYPLQSITLSAFQIDQTEVSIKEWNDCMTAGICDAPADFCQTWLENKATDHPVSCISWDDAKRFCRWKGGSLPTEAQWEKASRGLDGRTFPWGEEPPDCNRANAVFYFVDPQTFSRCHESTVATIEPSQGASPFGLFHTAGNVAEWVADPYDALYYHRRSLSDPEPPTDGCYLWSEGWKTECKHRVVRGGSYTTEIKSSRLLTFARSFAKADTRTKNIGFRCAYP